MDPVDRQRVLSRWSLPLHTVLAQLGKADALHVSGTLQWLSLVSIHTYFDAQRCMSGLRPHRSPLLTHSVPWPAPQLLRVIPSRLVSPHRRQRLCAQSHLPAAVMAADAEKFEVLVTSPNASSMKKLQLSLAQVGSACICTSLAAAAGPKPESHLERHACRRASHSAQAPPPCRCTSQTACRRGRASTSQRS